MYCVCAAFMIWRCIVNNYTRSRTHTQTQMESPALIHSDYIAVIIIREIIAVSCGVVRYCAGGEVAGRYGAPVCVRLDFPALLVWLSVRFPFSEFTSSAAERWMIELFEAPSYHSSACFGSTSEFDSSRTHTHADLIEFHAKNKREHIIIIRACKNC